MVRYEGHSELSGKVRRSALPKTKMHDDNDSGRGYATVKRLLSTFL